MRREELADLVRPLLEAEGFELVDCSVSRTNRSQTFRIAMDRDEGVPVEACERVARRVGDLLDANPLLRGTYHLEVSSAGMNRPVWRPEHYRRFVGERVRVEFADPEAKPRFLVATIDGVEGDSIRLRPDRGDPRVVKLSGIAKANLQLDPWKPRRKREEGGGEA